MPDGNDGHDEPTVIDLVDDPVIADADAVSVTAFKLFTTWWSGVSFQLHHFIFDAGGNGIGQLVQLLLCGRQDENSILRLFAFCVVVGWHRVRGWVFLFWLWLCRRRGYPLILRVLPAAAGTA